MHEIIQLIQQYGVLAVCVSVLLEGSGLPFPSYPVLMLASAITLNSLTAPLVLIAAVAAALSADTIWYFAGTKLGPRIMRMVCRMSFSPDSCVRRTEKRFARVGPWALLLVKFLPGIALATIVFSGVTRLRLPRFLLFDAIGSAIYLGVPLVLGQVFHNAIIAMLLYFARFGQIGALIVAGLVALFLFWRWLRRRELIRLLRCNRITADELAQTIARGEDPPILELRSRTIPPAEGYIPGALPVFRSGIVRAIGDYSRDSQVIIYSSDPNLRLQIIAARALKSAGFRHIRPLEGGLKAWVASGQPVNFRPMPRVEATPKGQRNLEQGVSHRTPGSQRQRNSLVPRF